jgi:hypothetical protein
MLRYQCFCDIETFFTLTVKLVASKFSFANKNLSHCQKSNFFSPEMSFAGSEPIFAYTFCGPSF